MRQEGPYRVFISYAEKDRELVKVLGKFLEGSGVVAVQEPFQVGEDLSGGIPNSLRKADEVVILLTDRSIQSPWVPYEIGAALSLHKRVTPILAGVEESELPPILQHMQHVGFSELGGFQAELRERAANPFFQAEAAAASGRG